MKTLVLSSIVALGLANASQAQGIQGGILLGGGYLEEPGKAYAFAQLRGTFYEDDAFAHTVFLEYLGHTDDAVLEFPRPGGGSFFEDGDILFSNITVNYELELKLSSVFSLYVGAGAGVEIIDLDDRFDFTVDSDSNFVAQTFGGLRADFGNGFTAQLGVRYLMRENFALLGDQFITDDSTAYEVSIGFRF